MVDCIYVYFSLNHGRFIQISPKDLPKQYYVRHHLHQYIILFPETFERLKKYLVQRNCLIEVSGVKLLFCENATSFIFATSIEIEAAKIQRIFETLISNTGANGRIL